MSGILSRMHPGQQERHHTRPNVGDESTSFSRSARSFRAFLTNTFRRGRASATYWSTIPTLRKTGTPLNSGEATTFTGSALEHFWRRYAIFPTDHWHPWMLRRPRLSKDWLIPQASRRGADAVLSLATFK